MPAFPVLHELRSFRRTGNSLQSFHSGGRSGIGGARYARILQKILRGLDFAAGILIQNILEQLYPHFSMWLRRRHVDFAFRQKRGHVFHEIAEPCRDFLLG
jgi:hypothetical protein